MTPQPVKITIGDEALIIANLDPEVVSMIKNFVTEFVANFDKAHRVGALPDNATPVEIARCIMVITAADFEPMSRANKVMLYNLRHFI
jgi:hypothetical protein